MTQKKAVKLLVEAGIIPKNALQHLANYKLIPGDYVKSHGVRPVNLDQGGEAVDQFVNDLGDALKEDISTVQETDFNSNGDKHKGILFWADEYGGYHKQADVRVDKLGRVTIPSEEGFEDVSTISIDGGANKTVVRIEPRYEGDTQVAWVCYLTEEGDYAPESETKADQ